MKGAKLNVQTSGGDSPLHRAAYMGNVDIIKILVKSKGDVNLKNNDAQIPLSRAIVNEKIKAVKLLIELNSDIMIEDKNNKKAIDLTNNRQIQEIIISEYNDNNNNNND
eukprot:TRINITY_DN110_c0_g1_i7.p1 TRINITY_DN110_c0_g1~~TRINITY_DN110_c0_g1_i7.p1  ORF type:complete len:109 (-),score=28.19 TRINITY_DN110_c0_g1_i7:4-330(-)